MAEVRLGQVNAGHVRTGQYNSLAGVWGSGRVFRFSGKNLTQCSSQQQLSKLSKTARNRDLTNPSTFTLFSNGINQCKANWKFEISQKKRQTTSRRVAPQRNRSPNQDGDGDEDKNEGRTETEMETETKRQLPRQLSLAIPR